MADEDLDFDQDTPAGSLSGQAADAAEPNEHLLQLPRLARFAVLGATTPAQEARRRLAADIIGSKPQLRRSVERWAATASWRDAQRLAGNLDRAAAREDSPNLRSVAVAVRLLSLRTKDLPRLAAEHRAVGQALLACKARLPEDTPTTLRAEVDQIAFGWAALPVASNSGPFMPTLALTAAVHLAERLIENSVRAALDEHTNMRGGAVAESEGKEAAARGRQVEDGYVLIGQVDAKTTSRFRDLIRAHEHVLDIPVPLMTTPNLASVRTALENEFPYAVEVIDQVLLGLVGKPFVQVPPTLFVGDPGGGKSRFASRLAHLLGLPLWRTDGAQADGGAFAGTQRRWSTSEPCHALLAVSRARVANPAILVDELDKAPDRRDHGRLWDGLLAFLEPETARNYPDPALQVNLDLSHVNLLATANSLDPIPSPLRDRLRIINFPRARPEHLEALVPAAAAEIMRLSGLDGRFFEPLSPDEANLVRAGWGGGSVRRLHRILEVVIRHREAAKSRH